jgi:hypothetical protein
MHMAGYNATPAEEMPGGEPGNTGQPAPIEALPDDKVDAVIGAIAQLVASEPDAPNDLDQEFGRAILDTLRSIEAVGPAGVVPLVVARAVIKIAAEFKKRLAPPATEPPAEEQTTLGDTPTVEERSAASGTTVEDQARAAAEARAADPDADPRDRERPRPESIEKPNLVGVAEEAEAERRMREAGCICDHPQAPDDDVAAHSGDCPIKGHGVDIPF